MTLPGFEYPHQLQSECWQERACRQALTAIQARPDGITLAMPDVGAYFACLASYNSGTLHGAWVDLELISDVDDLQDCIDWILSTSPAPDAEEWAMHDSSGLPDCLSRSEWPDLEQLADYGAALSELSRFEWEPFCICCNDRGEVVDVEDFRDCYSGTYDSCTDFAYQLSENVGVMPDGLMPWPLTCIDWEQAWRDLQISGEYSADAASSGGVHIFRSF